MAALVAVACTVDQAGTGNGIQTDGGSGTSGTGGATLEGGAATGGSGGGWPEGGPAGASGIGGTGGASGTGGGSGSAGASGSGGSAGASGSGGSAGASGSGAAAGAAAAGSAGASGTSGTGGSGGTSGSGGTGGDPCNNQCTDVHATCNAGTCSCASGYTNTDTSGNAMTATCTNNATITGLEVTVGIDHGAAGELVIKLKSPGGTVIALTSRPGYGEAADNGTGNNQGATAGLAAANKITFSDAASDSAEDMGAGMNWDKVVCKDNPKICSYHPARGAAAGADTLSAAFGGTLTTGDWKLCVGDAFGGQYNATGSLKNWAMNLTTIGGPVSVQSGGLNVAIADDAYDGTEGTMACSTITVQ